LKSEHLEQAEFVSWFRKNFHPQHRIFAIPNGGKRSSSEAMRLKVEGVSAGVPDIFIPSLFLFIEMKKEKDGVLSKEQKNWLDYLNQVGYKAIVCNGCAEAIEATLSLTSPTQPVVPTSSLLA